MALELLVQPDQLLVRGGQLLLDSFDCGRASKLEARTGITDAYLVGEYRSQSIGASQSGLQFTGSMVTIGLKVDY